MVNIEVAVAKCMGRSKTRVKIGTISTPPPMPSSPEAIPPKKLKIAPSSTFCKGPNDTLLEFTLALPPSGLEERFGLIEFGSMSMGTATKRIMKKPKIRPNVLADMTVVKYTPRIPPGVVVTASTAPVLYDIRFCFENTNVDAKAVKTITV